MGGVGVGSEVRVPGVLLLQGEIKLRRERVPAGVVGRSRRQMHPFQNPDLRQLELGQTGVLSCRRAQKRLLNWMLQQERPGLLVQLQLWTGSGTCFGVFRRLAWKPWKM